MASLTKHKVPGAQAKKATPSGWIGSVLEYYDFFIYATAASLIFPQIFFPQGNPKMALIASLATYGVGYVARPIGAFVLGHWGDTHGRKNVLIVCMFLMGISTMAVGLLPTYAAGRHARPDPAGDPAPDPGLRGGRRDFRRQFDDPRARPVRPARLLRQLHPAGRAGRPDPRRRRVPAAGALHGRSRFNAWGWRIPFLLSFVVIIAGFIIRRKVDETPAFTEEAAEGHRPKAPVIQAVQENWRDMLRVVCMALMNVIPVVATIFGAAYAVQPAYGIGFAKDVYLWIPVLGNCLAILVIPFVGNLSDKIGRRPPIIVGALASGLLSFGYLYAISIHNVPLAIVMSLLMWGVVYQGYNAVFPSFYPELFPTRTRVSAMAISQNIGTLVTAMLPALFAWVAPPGSPNIPLTVGAIAFGVTIIAALAALSARETYRVRMDDLGSATATPVDKAEYDRLREQSVSNAKSHQIAA